MVIEWRVTLYGDDHKRKFKANKQIKGCYKNNFNFVLSVREIKYNLTWL